MLITLLALLAVLAFANGANDNCKGRCDAGGLRLGDASAGDGLGAISDRGRRMQSCRSGCRRD